MPLQAFQVPQRAHLLLTTLLLALLTLSSRAAAVEYTSLYSNTAYQCAAQACPLPTESCVNQAACNTILACRDTCYQTHANDKLLQVSCLDSCQVTSSETGLLLYNQFQSCYILMCQDVYEDELCNGYESASICEDQEGCTFRENEAIPCQFGDFAAPEFVRCEIDIVRDARENEPFEIVSWRTIEAADDNSFTLTQTQGLTSGSDFPVGTTQIQYKAEDESGNINYCNFTVTVADGTAPVFTSCPQSRTIHPTRNDIVTDDMHIPRVAVTWVMPTFIDNVGASFTADSPQSTTAYLTAGTHMMTYTAEDVGGNTATCTFNIVVDPASTTYFIVRNEKDSVGHSILTSFPVGVSIDACATRCLASAQCEGFIADRAGIGRCTLIRGTTDYSQSVTTNVYVRQANSVFECLYDDITECSDLLDGRNSTNCDQKITDYEDCVTPLLASCYDTTVVDTVTASIASYSDECTGSTPPPEMVPEVTDSFNCSSLASSTTNCFGCCTDAYASSLSDCEDLTSLAEDCQSARYDLYNTCSGVCLDARSTSAPVAPTPSSFVDITLPIALTVTSTDTDDAPLLARTLLTVASVFGFDESALHMDASAPVFDGATMTYVVDITFSIRLSSDFEVPEVVALMGSGASAPNRRRRNALDAANIATFFQSASNVDALLAQLEALLGSALGSTFSAVDLNGSLVADVADDANDLIPASSTTGATNPFSTVPSTTPGTTTTATTTTTLPLGSGGAASGSANSASDAGTTSVIAVAVIGVVVFVIILVILVRTITRRKHKRARQQFAPHQARKQVKGGTFGNGRVLPNILEQQAQYSGTDQRLSSSSSGLSNPRPQPPAKLPSMSRPTLDDPFTRAPRKPSVTITTTPTAARRASSSLSKGVTAPMNSSGSRTASVNGSRTNSPNMADNKKRPSIPSTLNAPSTTTTTTASDGNSTQEQQAPKNHTADVLRLNDDVDDDDDEREPETTSQGSRTSNNANSNSSRSSSAEAKKKETKGIAFEKTGESSTDGDSTGPEQPSTLEL